MAARQVACLVQKAVLFSRKSLFCKYASGEFHFS